MKNYVKRGWKLTFKHIYIMIALFIYELIWGFFIYRTVESIVVPLLRRFPDTLGIDSAIPLFLAEAQFRLMKTDLISPYLWLFGGLLGVRILITPIINAGLLYSLCHTNDDGNTHFLQGIRTAWRPITLLYFIETLLMLTPLAWLLPLAWKLLVSSGSLTGLLEEMMPYIAGWLAWAVLLHLLFLAMQLGAVSGTGIWRTLWTALRRILPFLAISFMMWLMSIFVSATVTSVSMMLAGLVALIVNQTYYLIRTLMKVWTIAAQYETLRTDT
ncbi:hypothetical protein [Paenibacillus sp. GCM10027626]|uniref:hypothetical protein n=1 Tax=Paenibacillus sp. GCM10027626 TaxID=3273411 RepID=UPI00363460DC